MHIKSREAASWLAGSELISGGNLWPISIKKKDRFQLIHPAGKPGVSSSDMAFCHRSQLYQNTQFVLWLGLLSNISISTLTSQRMHACMHAHMHTLKQTFTLTYSHVASS